VLLRRACHACLQMHLCGGCVAGDLLSTKVALADVPLSPTHPPQERLTLKHRNSSKWARRALKRGQAAMDPSTREAIAEQLALGQQLRRRVEGRRGNDSGDDDGQGGGSSDRWARKPSQPCSS
jgi:hypothetical protein